MFWCEGGGSSGGSQTWALNSVKLSMCTILTKLLKHSFISRALVNKKTTHFHPGTSTALFCLKCKVLTKQLSIRDFFCKKLLAHRYQSCFFFFYYFCRSKNKIHIFHYLLFSCVSDIFNAFQQLSVLLHLSATLFLL